MKTNINCLRIFTFFGLFFYGSLAFSQMSTNPQIVEFLTEKLGSDKIPDDILTSFFENGGYVERAELIYGWMKDLEAIKDTGSKSDKKKISDQIEKYGVRLAEGLSRHWYKQILENNAMSNINLAKGFPMLEKDLELLLKSSSENCKKNLIQLWQLQRATIKGFVDKAEAIQIYNQELQYVMINSTEDPCNASLKIKLKLLDKNINEVKQTQEKITIFEKGIKSDAPLTLGVKCLAATSSNPNLKPILNYIDVVKQQLKNVQHAFEDKAEWRKKNTCDIVEPVSNEACQSYIDKYLTDFEETINNFQKLGFARFKLNSMKADAGQYGCANKDFVDLYNSVDIKSDKSISEIQDLIKELELKLKKGKCINENQEELNTLKKQSESKVDFIKRDLIDLQELFNEFALWIQENPCQNDNRSDSENDCLDKNKELDPDGKCVCKKGFTPSPSGSCVSIADILSQSLDDNDETNNDCAELGEKYANKFDNARIMVEQLSLDATYNGEVAHRFLADPTLLHCCNTGLTTSMSMVVNVNEQIQSIWIGIAENVYDIMSDGSHCPDEVNILIDKIKPIKESAELVGEVEKILYEKWESYNCTEDDIKAATNRGIEDQRRDALGSKIGAGTREIPCDGIDNDGDGEVDENSEDPENKEDEIDSEIPLFHAVKLSGHGFRKFWGGLVDEFDGYQIIIFYVDIGETIEEKVAAYEAGQIEGSDFWCNEGPRLCPCGVDPDIWTDGPYLEILDSGETRAEMYAKYDTSCDKKNGSFPCISWNIELVSFEELPAECR